LPLTYILAALASSPEEIFVLGYLVTLYRLQTLFTVMYIELGRVGRKWLRHISRCHLGIRLDRVRKINSGVADIQTVMLTR